VAVVTIEYHTHCLSIAKASFWDITFLGFEIEGLYGVIEDITME